MERVQDFQCPLPRIGPLISSSLSWQLRRGIFKLAWKLEVWTEQLLWRDGAVQQTGGRVQLKSWSHTVPNHGPDTYWPGELE